MFRIHPLTIPLSQPRGAMPDPSAEAPLSLEGIVRDPSHETPHLTRGDCRQTRPVLSHSSVRRCLEGGSGGGRCSCQRQFHRTGHVKPARITSSRSHNSGRMTFVASCFMLAVDIKRLTCTNQRLPSSFFARRVGPACARSRFEPSRCFAPNPEFGRDVVDNTLQPIEAYAIPVQMSSIVVRIRLAARRPLMHDEAAA